MLKTIAMPIHRSDIRKSFAGFASRGYRGCEQDCMMDEMVKRVFKDVSDTSSSHYDTTVYDENDNHCGRVKFSNLADGYSPAKCYDDICMEVICGTFPKNADEVYRHVINKVGKLVELTYDPDKVQLR